MGTGANCRFPTTFFIVPPSYDLLSRRNALMPSSGTLAKFSALIMKRMTPLAEGARICAGEQ